IFACICAPAARRSPRPGSTSGRRRRSARGEGWSAARRRARQQLEQRGVKAQPEEPLRKRARRDFRETRQTRGPAPPAEREYFHPVASRERLAFAAEIEVVIQLVGEQCG